MCLPRLTLQQLFQERDKQTLMKILRKNQLIDMLRSI